MRPRTRILIGVGIALILILVAFLSLGYVLVTKSFPRTEGTLTTRGLKDPVRIYRDSFGMPHIVARSDHDAYVAAGFVHAQDRMWQMELVRRAGLGRLSEILGEPALRTDKLFRTLRLAALAEETVRHLAEPTLDALQAYADGVNACIENSKGKYPLEFDMLGVEPEPWKIEHSILLAKLMAWELNYSRWVDITYGYVVEKLGADRARELYPDWPSSAPTIVAPELKGKNVASLGKQLLEADREFRQLVGSADFGTGSNAWVISGEKSSTGKPILANDPHLVLTAPARWYEMHVVSPTMDVTGASLAGIPFVVIGRNQRIAWGVTNAMIDDEDFYVEEVDSVNYPTRYRYNGGWRNIEHHIDTILVKDQAPVILTTYRTHRGPIVNRIEPAAQLSPYLLSMRWTATDVSLEAEAFYLINRATNWKEFLTGLQYFSAPAQNFVYADTEGNIGYHTGGRIPRRKVQGFASPFPGWTDAYDWQGYVPFSMNPQSYNPSEEFIATANNKIVDDSYPYYVSNNWEPSWRVRRLHELLRSYETMDIEDHQRMQLDLVSPQARMLVPVILRAYDKGEPRNEDVATTLNYFRNWTYSMREEDVATTLFQAFLLRMIHNTFDDELGQTVAALYDTLASRPMIAITELLLKDSSAWFDDVRTMQTEGKDEQVRRSLEEGIEMIRRTLGGELKEWRWGTVHEVEFGHIFSGNQLLRPLFNVGPFSVGGSHSTVWKGDFYLSAPFRNSVGPSTRQIFDLSDANNTRAVTPPGQSGQSYHRNYKDQISLWLAGAYRKVPMDVDRIEQSGYDMLVLEPPR